MVTLGIDTKPVPTFKTIPFPSAILSSAFVRKVMLPTGSGCTMNRLLRTTCLEMLEDRTTPAAVGGLDLPFGTSGLVDVAFDLAGSKADTANAVAVQRDGKILVVLQLLLLCV